MLPSSIGVAELKMMCRSPGWIFDVEGAAKRHEPRVAHMALGGRLGRAGHAKCGRRIVDGDDGFGAEAVIGLNELVFFRLGLAQQAERRLVDKGEMRIVERVFHHSQRRRIPSIVELVDAPIGGITVLRQVRNGKQRLLEGHPHVAVARIAVESLHSRVRKRLFGSELRNPHELSGAVVGPPMIAARDVAIPAPAFRQLGGAMAATVGQRGRIALTVEEQDDLLAQQRERFWSIVKLVDRQGGVPEAAEDFLFGAEHGSVPSIGWVKPPDAPRPATRHGEAVRDRARGSLRRRPPRGPR